METVDAANEGKASAASEALGDGGGGGALRVAFSRSDLPRADRAPRALRSGRGAALDAALDQDRRLSRGLRLLPAVGALPDRCGRRGSAADRIRRRCRARRQGERRDPLLHGCGVARTEGAGHRSRRGHGAGGERSGAGDLRHAGHAQARAGRDAQGGRARLLQPQSGYRARVLRRDHRHAHLRATGSTRSSRCVRRVSTCAAAASSAWANRAGTAPS